MPPNLLSFRIQTAAGLYSQLTGVLAGFVFTALILMLGNPPAGQPVQVISVPLLALLMVFFSLIVASFLFAVVTGDESDRRAHVLAVLASGIFALASVEMFLSVVWFFGAYQVGGPVLASTRLLFHGVVLIASLWNAVMMGDAARILGWGGGGPVRPRPGRLALALALPALGVILRTGVIGPAGVRTFTALLTAAAGFTILLALYSGVARSLTDDGLRRGFPASAGTALVIMVGAMLLLCELSLP